MANKAKVSFEGQNHVGVRVGLKETAEPWARIELDDGSIVRLKTVVTEVVRVLDKYDAEGVPIYVVKSTNIASVECPEHLRKDAQKTPKEVQ